MDQNIKDAEHELQGAKPIGQQRKALVARHAKAVSNVDQWVVTVDEAKMEHEAAGQRYLEATSTLEEVKDAADAIGAEEAAITG